MNRKVVNIQLPPTGQDSAAVDRSDALCWGNAHDVGDPLIDSGGPAARLVTGITRGRPLSFMSRLLPRVMLKGGTAFRLTSQKKAS